MSALAIGTSTVKQYNIIVALIDLCTVPLVYYLFTLGYNPVFAFVGKFSTMVISQIYRLYFINKKLNLTKRNFVSSFSECRRGVLSTIRYHLYIRYYPQLFFIGAYWTIHHLRNGINLCHFNLRLNTAEKISCLAI